MSTLAINGGKPVRTAPWPPWPHFEQDEIDGVTEVLRSGNVNYWTGEHGRLFEKEFAQFVQSKYAVAVANGSVALELALAVLGIGAGDEVIVSSRTFIASASCAVMRGAIPVFADIDPVSQNFTVDTIKKVLTPRVKAIICVHLSGWPCEMDEIIVFARQHNLFIIEDCAQSLGAKYKGKMAGTLGDIAAFSFCQDKIMTTGGEGGMLVTNNEQWYTAAWSYKDHGKDFDFYNKGITKNSVYTSLGTNWRMTEMQSVIGRIALRKVPGWLEKRRKYASLLNNDLRDVSGLQITIPPSYIQHAYYKYYCFVKIDRLKKGWDRDQIIDAVCAEGVVCQAGSTWAIGREFGWEHVRPVGTRIDINLRSHDYLPIDFQVGISSLMFQVHPTLDEQAIIDTAVAVKKVISVAVA
jgi:hypothetical protein